MRIVVTVKAYPVMTERHGEAVCVAGITREIGEHGEAQWIRLYPVPFRDMPDEQQFKKWDEVEVEVEPSNEDNRPETRIPTVSSLRIIDHLDTKQGWRARRQFLAGLEQRTMCQVLMAERTTGLSLAMIRPARIVDVTVDRRDEEELRRARLRIEAHQTLFGQELRTLDPLPFVFRYKYSCGGNCRGHEQTIIDWELAALFRGERYRHGETRAIESVREKYLSLADSRTHDFALFVGNQERYRRSFLVIGVFYPKLAR